MGNFVKGTNESIQILLCLLLIFIIQSNTCEQITQPTPGNQMKLDPESNFSIHQYENNLKKYSSSVDSKLNYYWNPPLTQRLKIKNQYFKGQNFQHSQPYLFGFAAPYFPLRSSMRGLVNNRQKKSFGALTRLYSQYIGSSREKSKETRTPTNNNYSNNPASILRIGRHFFSSPNPFERWQNSGEYNQYRRPLAMRLRWG